MLDGFEEGLIRLAGANEDSALLDRVLVRIARENRFAAVWRRVLSAAIREPNGLGCRVWTLATAVPVIIAEDTVELVGRYLQAAFHLLTAADREAIERAILSIRAADPDDADFFAERRDRLLGCLPASNVVTAEAKARLRELEDAGGPPENTPLFDMGDAICEEFTETHWLEAQGVQVEAEPNRRLRTVSEPAGQFGRQFMNEPPTREQASAILMSLRELREILTRGGDGADPRVVLSASNHLASACAAVASAEWLEGDPATTGFIRAVLLEASRHEHPGPDARRDQHYEDHASLSPSPRFYAADGLLKLVRFPSLVDPEMTGAIDLLSEDRCAEIRSAVGRHLAALYRSAPESFWRLLRRVEAAESSRRIIHYTLAGVRHLTRQQPAEMLDIASAVFERFRNDPQAVDIRCVCLSVVFTANSLTEDPYGGAMIRTIVSDMTKYTADARHLVRTAAELLTIGPIAPPDRQKDRLRLASFTFLEGIATAIREWLQSLERRLLAPQRHSWPADLQPQIEAAHRVAHELGIQTYFASGSFDQEMGEQNPRRSEMNDAMKQRFLHEALPLLSLIAEFGIPDVVHHCLEIFANYVSVDPRVVFLAVARAVRYGQARGYQDEPLAVDLVAGLVRRYIADNRSLFREDTECRDALIELLNIFVLAGWPEAMDLTCRLDEVFR
jgi:hypothetical protein